MAGHEQQNRRGNEFVLGESGAVGVGDRDQVRDEVRAGGDAAQRDQLAQVGDELAGGAFGDVLLVSGSPYSYIFTMALDHGWSR